VLETDLTRYRQGQFGNFPRRGYLIGITPKISHFLFSILSPKMLARLFSSFPLLYRFPLFSPYHTMLSNFLPHESNIIGSFSSSLKNNKKLWIDISISSHRDSFETRVLVRKLWVGVKMSKQRSRCYGLQENNKIGLV
jgi:hypothetical protein